MCHICLLRCLHKFKVTFPKSDDVSPRFITSCLTSSLRFVVIRGWSKVPMEQATCMIICHKLINNQSLTDLLLRLTFHFIAQIFQTIAHLASSSINYLQTTNRKLLFLQLFWVPNPSKTKNPWICSFKKFQGYPSIDTTWPRWNPIYVLKLPRGWRTGNGSGINLRGRETAGDACSAQARLTWLPWSGAVQLEQLELGGFPEILLGCPVGS